MTMEQELTPPQGYEYQRTGGGCLAAVQHTQGLAVVLTNEDLGALEESDVVLVGIYTESGWSYEAAEPLESGNYNGLAAALAAVPDMVKRAKGSNT